MARIQCPECGSPADDQDLACAHCELILNPRAPGGRYVASQPSIVRALLSPSDWSGVRQIPKPPPGHKVYEQVTVRREVSVTGDEVPRLLAGVDVALSPLHPFEAYVVSFCDGLTSVRDVAQSAQLRIVEVNAVISSLLERRLLQLDRNRAPASPEGPSAQSRPVTGAVPAAAPLTGPGVPAAISNRSLIAQRAPPSSGRMPTGPQPVSTPPQRVDSPPRQASGLTPASGSAAASRQADPSRPSPSGGVPNALRTSSPRVVPLDRALAPDAAQNVLEHAVMLERKGQVRGAIDVLTRGIAQVPKAAPLYNKLALILLDQRRDYAQAEELLQKAVSLDEHNSVYQQNLIRVVALAASASVKDEEAESERRSSYEIHEPAPSSPAKKKPQSGFLSKLWKK